MIIGTGKSKGEVWSIDKNLETLSRVNAVVLRLNFFLKEISALFLCLFK